jgi:hypothetical protein
MTVHWIKHDGLEMPVPADAMVVAKRNNGSQVMGPAGHIGGWRHQNAPADITEFSCNADEISADTFRRYRPVERE